MPCACGSPDSPGVTHKTDGPCFVPIELKRKPTSAPSPCTFACSERYGTHGPKCSRYVRPEILRAVEENAATVRARMGIVGKYEDTMTPSLSRSYREWAAAQHGLEPDGPPKPRVRIRDIYIEGDGADPDWVL